MTTLSVPSSTGLSPSFDGSASSAASAPSASPAPGERRERRRFGALLNSYYSLDGGDKKSAAPEPASADHIDQQGFDARRYFEGVIASGQLPDLVNRSHALDAEVKDLNCGMQGIVYENFSKFMHATDVIRHMKACVDDLEPDIKQLAGNVVRLEEYQVRVENGINSRAGQLEAVVKRQEQCRKLQLLFGLPATLQFCLDKGAYRQAVQAYTRCEGFLRLYEHMPTFKKVVEDAGVKMLEVRSALERRLKSPELSVKEAMGSATTLLELGDDQSKVAAEYLMGRCAMLQTVLKQCFDVDAIGEAAKEEEEATAEGGEGAGASSALPELSREQRELCQFESVVLKWACNRVTELYVPQLCESVEGAKTLQDGRASSSTVANEGSRNVSSGGAEDALSEFAGARVQELCGHFLELVQRGQRCVPTRVLVKCVHKLRDNLGRLHDLLPRLLNRLFFDFLRNVASNALWALYSEAATLLVSDLCRLHDTCRHLQDAEPSSLDEVMEAIAKTEQSMMMHSFTALTDSEPLLGLLSVDRLAGQQLLRGLNGRLMAFFLAFVDACHAYASREPLDRQTMESSLAALPAMAVEGVESVTRLEWDGLFALALVRIGRHLEVKAIGKVWGVAQDIFAGSDVARTELAVHPALIKATRVAAQAVITHYTLVSGQHLANVFRDSMRSQNWRTMREPREPCHAVEEVLRRACVFDAQLVQILGDPRKARSAESRRAVLSQRKSAMELEIERQLARKLQIFASIPFNRNGAMLGILRIAFKALYEFTREETFAKFGLQQIQLDCAFLAEVVRDLVHAEDASTLDSLLDEAVASASQRCTEPIFMEAVIVEAVCDEKKRAFKVD